MSTKAEQIHQNPPSLPWVYEHSAGLTRWLNEEQAKYFKKWLEEQREGADRILRTSSNVVDIHRSQGFIMLADAITKLEENLNDYLKRKVKET